MQKVFSTGQAAKICKVSLQTIIRCFDNGQLGGFKVPGSKFRRIPRDALCKFMKSNGLSMDALETPSYKVLMVGVEVTLAACLTSLLPKTEGFEVRWACDGFAAGAEMREFDADAVCLECAMLGVSDVRAIVSGIRREPDREGVLLLGFVERGALSPWQEMGLAPFEKPFDAALLKLKITEDARVKAES